MPKTIEVVLVRHGQSVWNAEKRYQGQLSSGLTDIGRGQAEAAADVLLERFGESRLAISSDLQRVVETHQPWAQRSEVPVRLDPAWREIDAGAWSGLMPDVVKARWPEEVADFEAGRDIPRGGGETFADLRARSWKALTDLVATVANGPHECSGAAPVIVFTHGGPIRVLAAEILGLPPMGHRWLIAPANCSLTLVRHQVDDDGRLLSTELVAYNEDPTRTLTPMLTA